MRLGLILSNDWELFGDGSGDYFELQHRPLEDLLNILATHGAKLTVMAEVGQQWAHQKIADREPWARNLVEAWESILKETIRRSHDVQLHLHPQWLDAQFKNNAWQLNMDNLAVSELPCKTISNILTEGKLYLEKILRPVEPSYQCIGFRAGGYCIEPSCLVMKDLWNAGILCDTSVTKGFYNPAFFDYRDAYSNLLPWYADNAGIKCQAQGHGELLEVPIHSYPTVDIPLLRLMFPRLYYLLSASVWLNHTDKTWLLERKKTEFQRYPIRDRPLRAARKITSPRWFWSKVMARPWMRLDYDVLPPKVFAGRLQRVFHDTRLRQYEHDDIIIPVMASGHTKRMHNCDNIDGILNEIQSRLGHRLTFWTLREAIDYWITRNPIRCSPPESPIVTGHSTGARV